MKSQEQARRVFDIEIAALKAVRAHLDGAFDIAVEMIIQILTNRGKIVVVGVGKSGNIGTKIAATLTSTGSTSVVLNSVDALHGDLGIICDGDAILALSYSGETEELIRILPAFKRFAVKIISMTGEKSSRLAKHSDVVLNVKVPREACPFNLAPTSSTTAMLALGDALAMTIMNQRGFNQKDFARLHPEGSIGKTLLLRARDIMRTGDRLPLIPESMIVRDAIGKMIKAKAGSVCVINKMGKVAGIFTDGDLRRHFTEGTLLTSTIGKVMTRNPKVIKEDALVAEALKIFDEHAIDDLVVVDRLKRPVGLIDLQDLPKLKVM
ncbi:MAG: KpsF/GutQ family sugar-phosphate isomerase [Verrucomicrobiota bacterium]|nr:KpsF/GutQ family sugar-phosphate isomerase [Verrucomicrobiota bacterium]